VRVFAPHRAFTSARRIQITKLAASATKPSLLDAEKVFAPHNALTLVKLALVELGPALLNVNSPIFHAATVTSAKFRQGGALLLVEA